MPHELEEDVRQDSEGSNKSMEKRDHKAGEEKKRAALDSAMGSVGEAISFGRGGGAGFYRRGTVLGLG
ncbi:hypothetical protein FNV43_RR01698 [Rhamnella rubrinervis]|uniref:Uncharacterized protein n=1 Tax=Rhamnella rubrinervis TaxID=2594499 RepID=A0A8K0MSA0_9ROSA|nr:hypothetical protein FNV43_RR01698 [Rhamnella rubrinervis]